MGTSNYRFCLIFFVITVCIVFLLFLEDLTLLNATLFSTEESYSGGTEDAWEKTIQNNEEKHIPGKKSKPAEYDLALTTEEKEFGIPSKTKNDELYVITGIIIPRDNAVVIIALHEHSMTERCESLPPKCCSIAEDAPEELQGLPKRLQHAEKLALSCRLPGLDQTVTPRIVPSKAGIGIYSNQVVHTMIFDFGPEFQKLMNNKLVEVELYSFGQQILDFTIPTKWRASGQYYTEDTALNWRNMNFQKHKAGRITACITGNWDLIYYVPEFMEYHNVIGFDHVYFAVHRPKTDIVYTHYQKLLKPWIDEGFVTLISSYLEHVRFGPRARSKEVIVNTCLMHAKQHDDIMGVYDIDEFPVIHNEKKSIGEFFWGWLTAHPRKKFHHLCFWTLRSFTINPPHDAERAAMQWLGDKFDHRGVESNGVWQKSFNVVKSVYLAGIHIPGSCNVSDWTKKPWPSETPGAYFLEDTDIAMHHFMSAFKSRRFEKNFTMDEYKVQWYPTVRKRVDEKIKNGEIDQQVLDDLKQWTFEKYQGQK